MVQSVNTANENVEYSPLAATQHRLLNYELGTCIDDILVRYPLQYDQCKSTSKDCILL